MTTTPRTRRVLTAAVAALALSGTAGAAVAQGWGSSADKDQAADAQEESATTLEFAADPVGDATMIRDCDGETALNRPDTITLTCGDGLMTLEHLEWFDWGTDAAYADAQLVVAPTAAEGGEASSYAVTVTADQLVRGEAVQDYSRLTVEFQDDKPDFEEKTFTHELPTVEAMEGLDG